MKQGLPLSIKFVLGLMLVELVLIINNLKHPTFILVGLFTLEGLAAQFILLLLVVLSLALMYTALRRLTNSFLLIKWFYALLAVNSLLVLVFSVFYAADYAGFLERIYGVDVFFGYIMMTALSFIIAFFISVIIDKNRVFFRF